MARAVVAAGSVGAGPLHCEQCEHGVACKLCAYGVSTVSIVSSVSTVLLVSK